MMRIEREVVEVWDLLKWSSHQETQHSAHGTTYVLQVFHELRVFVSNVFFHERCRFEQLLACLAPEFTLVFLLDVLFACLAQLPTKSLLAKKG